MSVNAIERIFWEFSAEPLRVKSYRRDPATYLSRYALTDGERTMVRAMDVLALEAHGLSHWVGMGAAGNYEMELLLYEPIHPWVTGTAMVELKLSA